MTGTRTIVGPAPRRPRRSRPLLACEWRDVLMAHWSVAPAALQPYVPFALDVLAGRAYVSVVAFTLTNLRLGVGGRATRWLTRPLANHPFLNVRTYVRHRGDPGIFFLAEWLPNRLAVLLGPRVYGLPYRVGRLDYTPGHAHGRVTAAEGRFAFNLHAFVPGEAARCAAGSRDAFVMERYTAFTRRGRWRRRFDVVHEPWVKRDADLRIDDASLLRATGGWFAEARFVGAALAGGALSVAMSRPQRLPRAAPGPDPRCAPGSAVGPGRP